MGDHEYAPTAVKEDSPALAAAKAELDAAKTLALFGNSLAIRQWIYRVAIAVLLIVTGFTTIDAVTMSDWTRLLEALLSLSAAGGFAVAKSNAS